MLPSWAVGVWAAGPLLLKECRTLNGCKTGEAKITGGYRLPAKHVVHTVGPVYQPAQPELMAAQLGSCYRNALDLAKASGLRQIAFPCISTGVYSYPHEAAATVALTTVRDWLKTDDNEEKIDLVIFCMFLPVDAQIYKRLMPTIFGE
ncbi:hypothetical protein HDV03_003712 [Kappamyces sp. JEL0829]|nr:hypothetical protein HDV03_003712 [Kappamyces sp. JEL0829]